MPSTPSKPDPKYLAPYARVVERRGPCFEALLWRSRETQTERFRVITEVVDLTGLVVCDLGCGRADLPAYLAEREVRYGRYVGVEALEELVGYSRERAAREGLAECEFVGEDFAADPTIFDRLVRDRGVECWVFSGSLNTMDQGLAEAVLERAWRATGPDGRLVFNFLSDRDGGPRASEDDEGPARRFSTLRMARWALERTSRLVLRHDYLDGQDATIVMRPAGDGAWRRATG